MGLVLTSTHECPVEQPMEDSMPHFAASQSIFVFVIMRLRLNLLDRLTESEAAVQKRLAWAEQQASAAAMPGLFSCTIQDSSPDAAYDALKRAVAALSPFVRNKLQGLPADVLDYADLIASSSVEQAILKPVVIAGEIHIASVLSCMPTGSGHRQQAVWHSAGWCDAMHVDCTTDHTQVAVHCNCQPS